MTTPTQRITRLLNEGARFMVQLPNTTSIDLTPDVVAAIAEVQNHRAEFEPDKESFCQSDRRRGSPDLC